jgi:two-component system, NarL family, sensor kinase
MERPHPHHLLMLALAGILLAPALAFLGLRLDTGFANDRLQPGSRTVSRAGLVVTPVDAPPGGLEAGDLVTHVDGRHLDEWAQALFRGGVARPRWEIGETVPYRVLRNGQPLEVAVTLEPYPLGRISQRNWGTIAFALAFFSLATYVLARRPQTAAVYPLFLSASAVLSATTWSLGMQASDIVGGTGFWLFQFTTLIAFMMFWIAGVHFALVFPRPLSLLRVRRLLPAIYAAPYFLLLVYLWLTYRHTLSEETGHGLSLDWISLWEPVTGAHGAVFMLLMLLAILWQYRAHQQGVWRQQLRWLTWAVIVSGGSGLVLYLLPPLFGRPALDANLMGLIILTFPGALAVAILRHNLFDIDTLLNRTIVYGGLTAVVITIYVVVVGILGALFQARGDLFVSLVATGVVAVAFQPLRQWLQQAVNRFMVGDRDQPFDVLARLGQRLETTLTPEKTLPTLVATVAETLRLPYVALRLFKEGNGEETAAEYGKPVAQAVTFPLNYQGEQIGALLVAPRAADEMFTPAENRLLTNIARQAGTAVYAVQLTTQLRRSRQHIIAAREEERRRLRRDLHDGLGPQLASQSLALDAVAKLMDKEPEAARHLLRMLRQQAQEAIADVRRLVYDLRPPALDELGLVGALRESAARYESNGLQFVFHAPEHGPQLPAAVEVAAFRIIQEAMANVVHHAHATTCSVNIAVRESVLHIEVCDDGRGVSAGDRAGVGLHSMRERAAELDGSCRIEPGPESGTRVVARLPII